MAKGTWYPTKQAWAEAKAEECRKQVEELRIRPTNRAHKTREKYADIRFLLDEARKYTAMATRFKAAGM
ncbi:MULTISPECIES: hypothetical protein [unclassified Dyella]|uniref:hypothetical protein n=1 Tax=Dyella sp. ASV21 TaxID=2795114 RepID=UPI0018EBB7AB|nr:MULTISPECIES: hypothetical protein [unclassified Dyella]